MNSMPLMMAAVMATRRGAMEGLAEAMLPTMIQLPDAQRVLVSYMSTDRLLRNAEQEAVNLVKNALLAVEMIAGQAGQLLTEEELGKFGSFAKYVKQLPDSWHGKILQPKKAQKGGKINP